MIVSGDGDYVPLIRRLHALGKRSLVATTSQPKAGIVNKLLPSVADHFHVIDVPTAPAPLAEPRVPAAKKAAPATKTAPAKKAPTGKKSPADHPGFKLYRASVVKLVNEDPALWVNGQVNAQRLGTLLRKHWPEVTYKTFGFSNAAA